MVILIFCSDFVFGFRVTCSDFVSGFVYLILSFLASLSRAVLSLWVWCQAFVLTYCWPEPNLSNSSMSLLLRAAAPFKTSIFYFTTPLVCGLQ